MEVNVCFDLGSDTLKVVFSYNNNGISYGKVVKNVYDDTAFPGTAFYDEVNKKWLFANDIDDSGIESYTTVVKIKKLLTLLEQLNSNMSMAETRNKNYYFNEHHFPKFYFPVRIKLSNENDYQEKVKKDMTFICPDKTPQQVCEDYFRYIKKIVDEKIKSIATKTKKVITKVKYGVIYPPKVGHEYIQELNRIITVVFAKPVLSKSSTKAISMYAYHLNLFKNGEPILIFDMGESKIQIAKAKLVTQGDFNGIAVDSIEGHSAPKELGGDDIDRAIVDYLERSVERRETMGSASYGTVGHIVERGVHSKQYLLMKSVKQAKAILSDPKSKTNIFKDGVPVTMHRDVFIPNTLTEQALLECIGVSGNKNKNSIANQIVDYIIKEIELPINKDTRKILLSGGLIETLGLFDYIKSEISKKVRRNIEIFTLEAKSESEADDKINSYEDSVYSAALGGVMVMQMGYKMKMTTTRSFGVNVVARTLADRCISIFIEKGTLFDEGEFIKRDYYSDSAKVEIEILSIDTTSNEIKEKTEKLLSEYNRAPYSSRISYREYNEYTQTFRKNQFPLVKGYIISKSGGESYYYEKYREGRNYYYQYHLIIGKGYDSYRQSVVANKDLKFKVLSGGNGAYLTFYYKNKRINFNEFYVANGSLKANFYQIGVRFDEEGRGFPEAKNDLSRNINNQVKIVYENNTTEIISCKDIEPRMPKLAVIDIGNDG